MYTSFKMILQTKNVYWCDIKKSLFDTMLTFYINERGKQR